MWLSEVIFQNKPMLILSIDILKLHGTKLGPLHVGVSCVAGLFEGPLTGGVGFIPGAHFLWRDVLLSLDTGERGLLGPAST